MKLEEYNFINIVQPLQDWFVRSARVLPWREDQTPYHVWISEIMLQQTRVEAVIGYYNRFLKKLPDLKALAESSEEEYLKLWEGLGYYSRVRNMHKAAVRIMEEYSGMIPRDPSDLMKLPGIGSYTAGAIASLAYGKRVPAVDGNVLRVTARLTGDDSDILDASTKKRLEICLQHLYDVTGNETDPRKINQGLMELGALVCIPNGKPDCGSCPLRPYCRAFLEGKTDILPVRKAKKARRIEDRTIVILQVGSRTVLRKRPFRGLLAGLWEPVNLTGTLTAEDVDLYIRKLGFSPLKSEQTEPAKHIFTHVEWHMTGYTAQAEEDPDSGEEQLQFCKDEGILLIDRTELEKYAVPSAFSAFRKYFE